MMRVKIPRRSASYVWDTNPRKFKLFSVVTAVDDACAQRHKTVGAKRIYTALEQQGVRVREHARDNNAAIAKNVREEHPTTKNQLDNWHAPKQLKNTLRTISEGLKKILGITWHEELINKATSVHHTHPKTVVAMLKLLNPSSKIPLNITMGIAPTAFLKADAKGKHCIMSPKEKELQNQ